ncbi:glycoside hydrolase family 127 protein [Granulicella arctica]|uniref:glycoside hydrolase family 127 protein n=1 Tax=Granulicella arctica TaxID=940613 RepID=UPI0021DF92BB|nr:glycoside hydrolase family 127 protein [Granulicella arctica]
MSPRVTRRTALEGIAAALSLPAFDHSYFVTQLRPEAPLEEFRYDQVSILGTRQIQQRENVLNILTGLNEDSLLYPFRAMSDTVGRPVPGTSLPGWYQWYPNYDFHHDVGGLAPGHSFGQWVSALSRFYAQSKFDDATGNTQLAEQARRLNQLMAECIGPGYFVKTVFPAYSYDKLVCGLKDAHCLADDKTAFAILDQITDYAAPSLPGRAVKRETAWKLGAGPEWMWDESYTIPENLYLVSALGAGPRYRGIAEQYLENSTYFEPLSRNVNVLSDRHAYSYINALSSAMQAYFVGKSAMHLEAARNGFAMLQQQSFATGGWGSNELLKKPGYDELASSLTSSHNSFETPCGSYAHMKLTRYLLRATRDGKYGDSMERVMLNTILGALPLQSDGHAFYHQDYNYIGKRIYSSTIWPCCAGTLPQVVADYGINTYFREPGAVWVNLYQPSKVRWMEGDNPITLEQTGEFLADGTVRLHIASSSPATFALRLRIPAWAGNKNMLLINNHPATIAAEKSFTTIERTWRNGDIVELRLPISLNLEAIPSNGGPEHPNTVALLYGPLVLLALRESSELGSLSLSRDALLAAERTGRMEWTVKSNSGPRRMVPFVEVGDRPYSTYVTAI